MRKVRGMRALRVSLGFLSLWIALSWASAAGAQPTFVKVLDSDDPVPGAPGAEWDLPVMFSYSGVSASGGEAAFIALSEDVDGSERWGVYRYRNGRVERVVDTSTPQPRTAQTFQVFRYVALDGEMLVFAKSFGGAAVGVYAVEGSTVRVIADYLTPIPGSEPKRFSAFGDVAVHDGMVLFGAGTDRSPFNWHQEGLYLSAGGALAQVVGQSTPRPGSDESFDLVGELGLDDDGYAFMRPRRNSSASLGVYRSAGDRLARVADEETIAPNTGQPFDDFRAFSYNDGVVAFMGVSSQQSGIFAHDGELRVIASRATPYPGTGSHWVQSPTASSGRRW